MGRLRVALADVDCPPDTSTLVPCDEAETASAIEVLRTRLLRRRMGLDSERGSRGALDRIVSGLRRLQNPHVAAYRTHDRILVSEPFNSVASVVQPATELMAKRAVQTMTEGKKPKRLARVLAAFGEHALEAAMRGGVRIEVVPDGTRYAERSPAVAALVPGIDEWNAPPSGLFVVEERRILLRGRALAMTAAHEFAHACDAVLAKRPRSYFSYESEELRSNFATTSGFVNEYAASGLDEYFAESVRAYLEINDSRCAWLPLTRHDLRTRDPRMFALIERLFVFGFARPA